ncbi:hypothetical protein BJ878DRAFT_513768 [Calycina marina]|uniref:CHY-type domain-containing protein n=1 Tax=Calycina marina TaxID=1763456 RepID=A0A9P8CD90_9HELO|nr:hypothetical protein BJ878DRAFT_513768 [Calycina marina]
MSAPILGSLSVSDVNELPEQPPTTTRVCRYFLQPGSCRAGAACSYVHLDSQDQLPDAPIVPDQRKARVMMVGGSAPEDNRTIQDCQQAVTKPIKRRVVPKPVPTLQIEDPRNFQIKQILRRFCAKEVVQPGKTLLKFNLVPSDPDFPFELAALECVLYVPDSYPKLRPVLKVENRDIPRGFTLNIEDGFDALVESRPSATLLDSMKSLDKNLEAFLSAPKAETIKIVANKDTRHLSTAPTRSVKPETRLLQPSSVTARSSAEVLKEATPMQSISFTVEEKSEAAKQRAFETRQLEARMGRLALFEKSSDGIAYTLPIEPRKRSELPVALQSVKTVQLFVPLLYPLQSCRIRLDGVDPEDAESVVRGFEQKFKEPSAIKLMGHVNHLAQNMHILAKTTTEPKPKQLPPPPEPVRHDEMASSGKGYDFEGYQDPERSHVHYISRPAEWTNVDTENADTNSDDSYSYGTDEESDGQEDGGVIVSHEGSSTNAQPAQEKGTAISFPFIELYGIELFEVSTLNISVKCERCKEATEMKGLKHGVPKIESCKKCAAPFTIDFRRELVHQNAVRAGYLDLQGCFIADMLSSTFVPTCSQCSTAYSSPGIVSVQGEHTSNVCRECHQKFSFKIHSVKFLRITSGSQLTPTSGPRHKKEILGITPGTELPRRGRCRHYTKSYRWFRFSCCQKVYACDKCHDQAEEHPNEWANRMICGFCSREGNYRPEDCGVCHSVLIGKKGGGGFWEGGKGTRDRVRMSRKDKRKFRRPGAAKINA